MLSCLFFLSQHNYKAGEGFRKGCTPAERDLCGLCTLPVTHPAGQPWTGAAHRRYRCHRQHCNSQAVCQPCPQCPTTVCTSLAASLMDAYTVVAVDRKVTILNTSWDCVTFRLNLLFLSFILCHLCVYFPYDLLHILRIVPRCNIFKHQCFILTTK